MESNTEFTTIHPGEILRDELELRGVKQKDFASAIGMPASVLNDIIKGKRNITPDIALLLEAALGKDAKSWMQLQVERDLEIAKGKQDTQQKIKNVKDWQLIQECCNITYLNKYLSNGNSSNIQEKIASVLDFFNVQTIDALTESFRKDINPAFFRKSNKYQNDPINLFTWKQIAYNTSKSIDALETFSEDKLSVLIEKLKKILYDNDGTLTKIKMVLARFGIHFLIIDNEKGTHIDGFSFWNGANPTIALTLRYKKLDILAFTLMHEICHVFYHLNGSEKSNNFITLPDMKDNAEEQEADVFANNVLMPAKEWQIFKERNSNVSPYSIGNKLKEFAQTYGIHPAIVLGRYQHDYKIFDNGRGFDRAIK